jgi:hypothetical protein
MQKLLGAIDADGSGEISLEEFVTGVGMMKRAVLEATALARAFEEIKYATASDVRLVETEKTTTANLAGLGRQVPVVFESEEKEERGEAAARFGEIELEAVVQPTAQFGEHELEAADLERAFGVTLEEAEEMIFLATRSLTDPGGRAARASGSFDERPASAATPTIDSMGFKRLVNMWS